MSSAHRLWKYRIQHMLDAITECQSFVLGMTQDQLGQDARTLKAIAFDLVILGEAARHVPPEIEAAYGTIPWHQVRGMRNHITHGYDQIDLEIVWKVVTVELPPLVPHLERILQEAVE